MHRRVCASVRMTSQPQSVQTIDRRRFQTRMNVRLMICGEADVSQISIDETVTARRGRLNRPEVLRRSPVITVRILRRYLSRLQRSVFAIVAVLVRVSYSDRSDRQSGRFDFPARRGSAIHSRASLVSPKLGSPILKPHLQRRSTR